MWGSNRRKRGQGAADEPEPEQRLRNAVRQVRIESAERTGVVVDLRDAEVARLELLNDELAPIFEEIPADVDMFDRGVSKGEVPRLWIDVITYIVMGRDKRQYRFIQDNRFGRKVLLETSQIPEMVEAVTRYVAGRLVERERAFAGDIDLSSRVMRDARRLRRRQTWRVIRAFVFGIVVTLATLFAAVWFLPAR